MNLLRSAMLAAVFTLAAHQSEAQSPAASAPAVAPQAKTTEAANKPMSAADCKKAAQMRHDHTSDRGGAAPTSIKGCPPDKAKASSPAAKDKTRHDHPATK